MAALPEDLVFNCPSIDRDHAVVVALTRQVARVLSAQAPNERVVKAVLQLSAGLQSHFENEEQLMERSGFGAAASHAREHHELTARFASVVKACVEQDHVFSIVMLATVDLWLDSHVRRTDRVLARHLRACGMHAQPGRGLGDSESNLAAELAAGPPVDSLW
jgi:hemerythrin-like metal-binding protein